MPADTHHEAFRQPDDPNSPLWRYMDVPKFISLLSSRALYFSQLARLEDPFEGTLTRDQYERHQSAVQRKVAKSKQVDGYFAGQTHLVRQSTYVNCWCLQLVESHALWRIYGGETGGIAIRTTYAKLRDALSEHHMMGLVHYIDYDQETIDGLNVLHLGMHKRDVFEYEGEIRALQFYISKRDKHQADHWIEAHSRPTPNEGFPLGIRVQVNLEKLIEAVVVSPYAPYWHETTIQALAHAFNVSIRVERSTMAAPPLHDVTPMTKKDQEVLQRFEKLA